MYKKCLTTLSSVALAATILVAVPSGAFAASAPVSASEHNSVTSVASPSITSAQGEATSTQELAATLESVFTKAIILDDSGVVSIDQDELRALLGDKEASEVISQFSATQHSSSSKVGAFNVARAASGQSFVDCMVDKSILGLIGGMTSGIYAELIREKKFYELAQKVMPRLIKAGVGGGIAGVVGSLAVSAVLCSR